MMSSWFTQKTSDKLQPSRYLGSARSCHSLSEKVRPSLAQSREFGSRKIAKMTTSSLSETSPPCSPSPHLGLCYNLVLRNNCTLYCSGRIYPTLYVLCDESHRYIVTQSHLWRGGLEGEVKRRNAGLMNRAPTNSPEIAVVGFIPPDKNHHPQEGNKQ
jgi:hypothetical protein